MKAASKFVWVALAIGGLSIACRDSVTSPKNGDGDFTMEGSVTSISWLITRGVPDSPSGVVQSLSVARHGDVLRTELGVAHPFALSESERIASQLSLPVMGLGHTGISGSRLSSAPENTRHRMSGIRHTRRPITTADGQHFDIEYIDDDASLDKRPPLSVTLLKDGKPLAQSEFTYVKERGRWKPSKSRSTLFDSTGHVHSVTLHDYNSVNTTLVGRVGARSRSERVYAQMGASLSRLVQPDVLYAADVCTYVDCVSEAIILAGAEAAWAAGLAAAGVALAGCAAAAVPTFGLACGPYVAAQFVLVGLDIALGVALGDYLNCKNRNMPNTPVWSLSPLGGASGLAPARVPSTLKPGSASFDCATGGGGGGSIPPSDQCSSQVWEISYNGGATWEYWGTFWTCTLV